jgi:hypothetical protein
LADQFSSVSYQHKASVGGFFGFKKTMMQTDFTLENSSFVPGQFVNISLSHMNSMSKHSIDSFRFKLFRHITYNTPDKKQVTSEYVAHEKALGCNKF